MYKEDDRIMISFKHRINRLVSYLIRCLISKQCRSITLCLLVIVFICLFSIVDQEHENHSKNITGTSRSCLQLAETSKVDLDFSSTFPTFQFSFSPSESEWRLWDDEAENRYKELEANKIPVTAIVVPFSHNDPLWLKTFAEVADTMARPIIDNIVMKLTEHENMTFVWTEVCLLAYWYHHEATKPKMRESLKKLLRSGRLEIVGGGWVMPDEAVTTTYALLDQMIEGYQWLFHHLNVTPTTSWAIDSFGHSATIPYLLHQAGVSNAMIVRFHYAWKEYFAQNQITDFVWRQSWDDKYDVVFHQHPYDSYSIPNSIGPNIEENKAFNFEVENNKSTPLPYSENLVDLFASEVKRTASISRHNLALIIVGDDFMYSNPEELDLKYKEFQKLFESINNNVEKNMQIRFGTLSDYFKQLRSKIAWQYMPIVSGDLFPYADVPESITPCYWTGYFTTRPHIKRLGRKLEQELRTAEVLFTSARQLDPKLWIPIEKQNISLSSAYNILVEARQTLGLFQHHDAITGTSKRYVMEDMKRRLSEAIDETIRMSTLSITSLISKRGSSFQWMNQESEDCGLESDKQVIYLIAFNPLMHHRHHHVRCRLLCSPMSSFKVTNENGVHVDVQLTKRVENQSKFFSWLFPCTLHFVMYLSPMSITRYRIRKLFAPGYSLHNVFSIPQIIPESSLAYSLLEHRKKIFHPKAIFLGNSYLLCEFHWRTGLLQHVYFHETGAKQKVQMKVLAYVAGSPAGAYISKPKSVMNFLDYLQSLYTFRIEISLQRGNVFSEIKSSIGEIFHQTARIYHDPTNLLSRGIYYEIYLDLFKLVQYKIEVVTQIRSFLEKSTFFTDSNGFQMIRRPRIESLNIEGNYYPITQMAYLDNAVDRMSLIVCQPHGVASLHDGWMEIMLDRRILTDDNKGMGEGVYDNQPHTSLFFLLFESRQNPSGIENQISKPSLLSLHISDIMNNPASIWKMEKEYEIRPRTSLFSHPFPCDLFLVNFRTLASENDFRTSSKRALLILHRRSTECGFSDEHVVTSSRCPHSESEIVELDPGMKFLICPVKNIKETSLTGLPKRGFVSNTNCLGKLRVPRMELRTWRVEF